MHNLWIMSQTVHGVYCFYTITHNDIHFNGVRKDKRKNIIIIFIPLKWFLDEVKKEEKRNFRVFGFAGCGSAVSFGIF